MQVAKPILINVYGYKFIIRSDVAAQNPWFNTYNSK